MIASRILCSIALAAYGLVATANGLDRASNRSPALESAVPAPFRAQADRSAASTALLRKESAKALDSARAAVASDPVDQDSAALLGMTSLASNQIDAADKAFRVAARFGWRNVATQAYFYEAGLGAEDWRVTADRADALLRTHPRLEDQQKLLEPLENEPAGRAVLLDHLVQQPPWLKSYLTLPPGSPRALVDRRYLVVSGLAARNVSLGCGMAAPFARSLVQSDRWADAKQFWNSNCPGQRVAGLVGDPSFSALEKMAAQEPPLGWHVFRGGDVSIRHNSSDGGGLQVTNSAAVARLILSQPVAFPSGIYRLRAVPVGDVPTTGTLDASLGCDGKFPLPTKLEGNLLTQGQILRVEACPKQNLSLWVGGGGAPVRVRSLEIQKIG